MHDVVRGRWSVRRVVVALVLALAAVATATVTHVQQAEAQQAEAQEGEELVTWEPGGQCFRSREPTEKEVKAYGVPAGRSGAHSNVLWAGPKDVGYYFPGCVPPGYEYNGVWWEKAKSIYEMVDCTEAVEPDCFWYATGNVSFEWSRKAFVGFTAPGGGDGGGGGGSPAPGPDGSVDCGHGIVLLGAEIDNAVATLRATGDFTEEGLADMRADPCRYFPTSCLNLSSYTRYYTEDARDELRDQLSAPTGLTGLSDQVLSDPCGFVDEQLVASVPPLGLIPTLPGVGVPPVTAPVPTPLLPPLPFTLPGELDPAVERCRYMTDATPSAPGAPGAPAAAPGALAAAPKSSASPSGPGGQPDPDARRYNRTARYVMRTADDYAVVKVDLNGAAVPRLGTGEFFEAVKFSSHVSVEVMANDDRANCIDVAGPAVEWIQIREVYNVVGADNRFRDTDLHWGCVRTPLCRRDTLEFDFDSERAASIGGRVTSARHYVFVTVKLVGQDDPRELPGIPTNPLEFS
jgi:hypothetical protein